MVVHTMFKRLQYELESALARVDSMRSSRGLASLPPEILTLVFSFTIFSPFPKDEDEEARRRAYRNEGKPRSLSAVRLSHVCRHFRNTVLSTPHLWAEVSVAPAMSLTSKPKVELVEACLQRSKEVPLDVILNIYEAAFPVEGEARFACDGAFFAVLPHAHRWRSLHLDICDVDNHNSNNFQGVFEKAQNIVAPNLECISQGQMGEDAGHDLLTMQWLSSWHVPKLHKLRVEGCFPLSLPDLSGITVLDLRVDSNSDHMALVHLTRVLLRTPSLFDLRVDFNDLNGLNEEEASRLRTLGAGSVDMKGVQTMTISCNASVEDAFYENLSAFFAVVSFPNALELHLTVSDDFRPFIDVRRLMQEICDGHRFPKVTTCCIKVHVPMHWDNAHNDFIDLSTTMPTKFPAELETLIFNCNTSLSLVDYVGESYGAVKVDKLRSLTLDVAYHRRKDSHALSNWMRWLIASMRQQGGWDGFKGMRVFQQGHRGNRIEHKEGYFVSRYFLDSWTSSGTSMFTCGPNVSYP